VKRNILYGRIVMPDRSTRKKEVEREKQRQLNDARNAKLLEEATTHTVVSSTRRKKAVRFRVMVKRG
jgi:hypothetical protein